MKHLDDITKISGYTAPIVDCIIGGSPCQDLSVAGKRAGLDGERSGLFMEQVRIVKEMRNRERLNGKSGVDIRPRYMVWENVPGALSSGKPKGEDFRIVLEEIAKVADKDAVIPEPPKGKWQNSGCILGDGWSIAWRILDAQFWGVPQRRRRIALVADFGGETASEILFVRKSVSGDSDESEPKRKEASSDASGGIGADDSNGCYCFEPGAAKGALVQEDKSATLATNNDQYLFQPVYSVENHPADSRVDIDESGKVQTLTSRMGTGGGNVPMVMQCFSKQRRAKTSTDFETWKESETANTLNVFDVVYALDRASFNQGKNAQFNFEVSDNGINSSLVAKGPGAVCYSINHQGGSVEQIEEGKSGILTASMNSSGNNKLSVCYSTNHGTFHTQVEEGICATLQATDYKDPPTVCFAVDRRNGTENETNGALQSNMAHSLNGNNVVRQRYIVRRLTPLECERLQGFPDNWTRIGEVVGYERQIDEITGEEYVQAIYEYTDANGKKRKTSDAARYKALGNSISIPNWKWVLKKLCACYERDATMASLFDGIGGFPYIWEQLNGKGSCLWASEIEEFPIAVTKVRIGE